MESASVQQLFFQQIKNTLPPHLSFVDEIAEVLNISNDSAYRRIRGEKPISLEEIQKLAIQFKLSLDRFLHLQSNSFLFTGELPGGAGDFLELWLTYALKQLSFIKSFERRHIYFNTKDLPFITYFQIPELANFKYFVWSRTILGDNELKFKKFSAKQRHAVHEELGRKVIEVYNQTSATEIWCHECLDATLRQIQYYRESDAFETDEDALAIYEKLEELINHHERQAEEGKKFAMGTSPEFAKSDYSLFLNEVYIGDNSLMAELNDIKMLFVNYSVINIMGTADAGITEYCFKCLQNLMRKSNQISVIGEKLRRAFFNELRAQIHQHRLRYV